MRKGFESWSSDTTIPTSPVWRPTAYDEKAKMLGGASQIVSKIRVKCNGK